MSKATDVVYGRRGGRIQPWTGERRCLHCNGRLPRGRYLFCSDNCSTQARGGTAA